MFTILVQGTDGAFYPVTIPEETIAEETITEETSFLKPHDELPKEAIENWEQFQNAHWQRILKKLGAQ